MACCVKAGDPEPHCASCNGTFIERVRQTCYIALAGARLHYLITVFDKKIENNDDDPREFAHALPDEGDDPVGLGAYNLLSQLHLPARLVKQIY